MQAVHGGTQVRERKTAKLCGKRQLRSNPIKLRKLCSKMKLLLLLLLLLSAGGCGGGHLWRYLQVPCNRPRRQVCQDLEAER